MNRYGERMTDKDPEYPIGGWPFVLSAVIWALILTWWVW